MNKSLSVVIGIFAVIILLFVVSFSVRKLTQPKYKTMDEMFEETLEKETDTGYTYNGYSFVKIDNLWYSRVKKPSTGEIFTIPLHYSPRDLEDISVVGDAYTFAGWIENENQVYVSFNPDQEGLSYVALANSELSASMIQVIGITPTVACDRYQAGACEDVPIMDCTTTDIPMIYISNENQTGVFQDGMCLYIQGNDYEVVKAMNRFLYTWFGVMK